MGHIEKSIEELKKQVIQKEKELIDIKKAVNQLCNLIEQPAIYIINQADKEQLAIQLKGDEYYMQPVARVIHKILERRKALGAGPASIREVYEEMKAGGFNFDAKNEQNAIRGIRASMIKNTAKFHKLPIGKFGLREWYPELKESNDATKKSNVKHKRRKKGSKPKDVTSVIKKILEERQRNGLDHATLEEIYDAMKAKKHKFTGRTIAFQKRGLSIAMGKNHEIFEKTSDGKWRLVKKDRATHVESSPE